MINPKLHDEFKAIDLTTGWETPPGYPEGIQQKILAGSLDEATPTPQTTSPLISVST